MSNILNNIFSSHFGIQTNIQLQIKNIVIIQIRIQELKKVRSSTIALLRQERVSRSRSSTSGLSPSEKKQHKTMKQFLLKQSPLLLMLHWGRELLTWQILGAHNRAPCWSRPSSPRQQHTRRAESRSHIRRPGNHHESHSIPPPVDVSLLLPLSLRRSTARPGLNSEGSPRRTSSYGCRTATE